MIAMSPHFCKIRSTRPNFSLGLKDLERKYLNFIEEAYNLIQTDSALSDYLYHEASKLKKTIFNLKNAN